MADHFPLSIVCPVDSGDPSAAALKYAAAFAAAGDAKVTVFHAHHFEVPPYFTPRQAEELRREYADAAGHAQRAIEAFVAKAAPSLSGAQVRTLEGDPVELLAHTARDVHADLIILGTHGRGRFETLVVGSVAQQILRQSELPVLTVREGDGSIKRIASAVNDSAASKSALRLAAQLAARFHAELFVVHVDEEHSNRPIGDLCSWISNVEHPTCVVREIRRSGHAAEEILKFTRDSNADLLVIGAEHRAFFDTTVLGETTMAVVRHAPCPVLSVVKRSES